MHCELPSAHLLESNEPVEKNPQKARGLQLWINLKAKDKMCEPDYQELTKEEVPVVELGSGISRDVNCLGSVCDAILGGLAWLFTFGQVNIWDIHFETNIDLKRELGAAEPDPIRENRAPWLANVCLQLSCSSRRSTVTVRRWRGCCR